MGPKIMNKYEYCHKSALGRLKPVLADSGDQCPLMDRLMASKSFAEAVHVEGKVGC